MSLTYLAASLQSCPCIVCQKRGFDHCAFLDVSPIPILASVTGDPLENSDGAGTSLVGEDATEIDPRANTDREKTPMPAGYKLYGCVRDEIVLPLSRLGQDNWRSSELTNHP